MSKPPANSAPPAESAAFDSRRSRQDYQPRPLTLRTRFLVWLIHVTARIVGATLRLTSENEALVQRLQAEKRGLIFVTWHGRLFIPLDYFRGRGYSALVSLSRDGDLVAESFRLSGFHIIRGSSSRRGIAAAREVLNVLGQGGVLSLVPDGPRGPSGKVQPGVVYFAQRSGCPIIPVGVSAWPRWRAPSWDRFLVPWPFARAVWINGEPIYVGPEDDLDEAAVRVERAIHAAEAEAERRVVPTSAQTSGV